MQMVDVQKREKCVQRRIDGGCNPILAERRKWIIAHHLVFVRLSAIQFFEVLEAVKIKKCKSRFLDRAKVSTAALDRKHADRLTSEWVWKLDLRARISTAEIGDAEIRTQQIRAIPQKRQGVRSQFGGLLFGPQIFQVRNFFDF